MSITITFRGGAQAMPRRTRRVDGSAGRSVSLRISLATLAASLLLALMQAAIARVH